MSGVLYRVTLTGHTVEPGRRCRQWLGVGETLLVAGYILMPMCARGDEPHMEIFEHGGETFGACPLAPMDFTNAGPYRVIPRAVRLAADGTTTTAVLLEIQYTGDGTPGWKTPQEDLCNEDVSAISDRR